jgi:hypothetical protein
MWGQYCSFHWAEVNWIAYEGWRWTITALYALEVVVGMLLISEYWSVQYRPFPKMCKEQAGLVMVLFSAIWFCVYAIWSPFRVGKVKKTKKPLISTLP